MYRAIVIDDNDQIAKQLTAVSHLFHVEIIDENFIIHLYELQPDFIFMKSSMSYEKCKRLYKYTAKNDILDRIIIIDELHNPYIHTMFKEAISVPFPFMQTDIDVLEERIKKYDMHSKSEQYEICLFHKFHMKDNKGNEIQLSFHTEKMKELFLYLLSFPTMTVTKKSLIQLLWNDMDEEHAYDNLYSNIYNIRKLLTDNNINIEILSSIEGYKILTHRTVLDIHYFHQLYYSIINDIHVEVDRCIIKDKFLKMQSLYAGAFLCDENYKWKWLLEEQFRLMFLSTLQQVVKYLLKYEAIDKVINYMEHIYVNFTLNEHVHFILMKLYARNKDYVKMEQQFYIYKELWQKYQLGKINIKIVKWFEKEKSG